MRNISNKFFIKKNQVILIGFLSIHFFCIVKYQQQFFEIYQKSSIQLRTIEQQRLLAIREQMRFAINLTMIPTG